ncbi:porin OmpA [Aeromonas diversa]|uniref:porin OmpA n=1 Tax=Aeromonas diversa TaxID=502790 RepID=UPI00346188A2
MQKRFLAVVVPALLVHGMAQAAVENTWYAGGKMGWSNYYGVELDPGIEQLFDQSGKSNTNSDDLGVGGFVGYQLNANLGFELGYDWLGTYQRHNEGVGYSLHGEGQAQMLQATMRISGAASDRLDIYGRLGGAYAWTDSDISAVSSLGSANAQASEHSPAFVGALGVEYTIDANWAARLEYQYTTPLGNTDLNKSGIEMDNGLLAFGMLYRFGPQGRSQTVPVEVAPPVAPAPATVVIPKRFTLSSDVLFEFDSARLKPASSGALNRLFEQLVAANPQDGAARIMGFTDRLGSDNYNQRLSEQRAQAVANYLIGKGLVASKVIVEGHGAQDPVTAGTCQQSAKQSLIACLAADRRVEVSLEVVAQP